MKRRFAIFCLIIFVILFDFFLNLFNIFILINKKLIGKIININQTS